MELMQRYLAPSSFDSKLHVGESQGRNTSPRHRGFRSATPSPFVGRDDELRRLTAALSFAAEGQGGTVFIAGQNGIGKTRLAQECLALARRRDFTVLEGRGLPLGRGLAYSPIIGAIDPLLRSLDSADLKALVAGLSDLGRLFDGVRLPPPEPLGDPALEKTRLFGAVDRLLKRLAEQAPVVLFVDDVHWADDSTLELLQYLASGLSRSRMLLLATFPADALEDSHSLQALAAWLLRAGLAEEIGVSYLRQDAVRELVQGILGGEAPDDLLALLTPRAGGVPLFVEALIAALIESGNLVRIDGGWVLVAKGSDAPPQSVRRLIADRLDRLNPVDRSILDLVTVMGQPTSYSSLLVASGLEEEVLLKALRHLRVRGLVLERTTGSDVAYSVTHPLIQEVAYAELTEMERRRIHLAAIRAFEGQGLDDASHLAYHYLGAAQEARGDRALAVMLASGERALAIYANEEAARFFESALPMARNDHVAHERGGNGDPLLARLLERLGEAWERIGKPGAAVEAWYEAQVLREQTADVLAVSRLRRLLARAEWSRGHFDIAQGHLKAGLALFDGVEPCQELVELYLARLEFFVHSRDIAGLLDTRAELSSLVKRLPSPTSEVRLNAIVSALALEQGDLVAARDYALRALAVAEQDRDLVNCCSVHGRLASIAMRVGDHRSMRHHSARGLDVARRLGHATREVILTVRMSQADLLSGNWSDSLRHSMEADTLARRIGSPLVLAYALAGRAMVMVWQGELPEAASCIAEVGAVFGNTLAVDRHVSSLVDIAETCLALERGEAERALGIAKGFVRPLAVDVRTDLTAEYVPMGLMLLAEAQVATGDLESALRTSRELINLGPAGTAYLTALSSRAEGLAMQGMNQHPSAIACLSRAREAFTAIQMPFEAARCLLERAVSLTTEQPESAVRAMQQSLVTFDRLGARRLADRTRRLLGGLGISPPARRRQRVAGVLLSQRELEIARLVAEGLTTAEIAECLVLSPRTISSHLDHIYTRLGIKSRAALTRYVTEAGLL